VPAEPRPAETPAAPVIEVRNLAVGYPGRRVLADVHWRVSPGEYWFLLGPNGSGKTTLLRAVLGLLQPLAGTIERDPSSASLEHTGFVPQQSRVNPTLPTTVREFVALGAVGLARSARTAGALEWALARVGLPDLAQRDLRALSGGQRQRALVARALVRRPRLLVLDEPTEGLDVASEEGFLATIEDLHREEQLTVLFVTHKLRIAARYATHVALFAAGRVRAGARDAVLVPADLEATFGVPLDRLDELRL
jgi:ABC-type Mn2+/Zn2+ transport system ATPase subunit